MDVSRLGIEVTSSGIDDATKALQGLGRAATSVEKRVTKLTDTLGKLMQVNLSATMQSWSGALGSLNTATASLNASIQSIVAAMNTQIATLNNLAAASNRAAAAQSNHNSGAGVFITTLKAMTSAALAYGAVNFAKSIIHNADEWTNLNLKMVAATGSQNNATIALQNAYEIAQKMALPLESTVKLYTRLAPAMAQAGFDSAKTKEVVVGLASAFHLGGATTGEMNQAILNFSHAIGGGHLNLRAFNSLTAEAPLVLRALANQMTHGNLDALRLLVSAHKVGAGDIVKAIESVQPAWDKLIQNRPVTVEMALTRIKNTWLKTIGEMATENQFNSKLAEGLQEVEKLIPRFVKAMGEAFGEVLKWVSQNKDKIAEIWTQVVGLGKDVLKIGEGLGKWVGAIAGAGDDFSLVAEIIFSIRLGIAGLQDGFVLVKNAVIDVGAQIILWILDPVLKAVEKVGKLIMGFGNILSLAAAGAKAAGMNDLAKQLTGAAEQAKSFGGFVKDIGTNAKESFAQVQKDAQASTEAILAGKGAVGQLMDEMDKQAEEAAKRKLKYDENYNKHPGETPDPKAIAAAERLTKEFERQKESLEVQIDQGIALNKELDTYGQEWEKIGPMQKQLIKYEDDLAEKKAKHADALAISRAQTLVDLASIAAMEERIADITKKNLEHDKGILSGLDNDIKTATDNLNALEDKVAAIGGMKGDRKDNAVQRAQDRLDIAEAGFTGLSPDATDADVQKVIDKDKELLRIAKQTADAQKLLDQASLNTAWDRLTDPKKAKTFGDTLTAAFGNAGKGLKVLVTGLQQYAEEQKRITEMQDVVSKTSDPKLKAQRETEAAQASTAAQIRMFGDLTEAAQGYFKKGTIGYEAMGAAEKVFRVAELANAVYNFVQKSGLLNAYTALFATSQTTQVAAAAAGSAGVVAAEAPKQAAYGVSALAAALTIPPPASYVAFAATAALLLAIGVGIAGANSHGHPNLAADRQKTQGTGTVLGDSEKQSESIAKSISDIADNTTIANSTSSAMLASLKSIEAALTGVTNSLLVTGSGATGKGFSGYNTVNSLGAVLKQEFKNSLNPLAPFQFADPKKMLGQLGFGSSKSLEDAGITFGNQTVGQALTNGVAAKAYQDVLTKHKSFWLTTGTSESRSTSALDPSTTAAFQQVINQMVTTVSDAAQGLGMNAQQVSDKLKAVQLSLGDISLKGLSGDEITKQLEAVFSAFGDKLVQAGLGDAVTAFQHSGEGLLETAVRVAAGIDQAGTQLEKLGVNAINFSDVVNKQGDVATEIVRQSLMAKEGADGVSAIISTMQGDAATLAQTYQSLVSVKLSLKQLGIANDVSADLIKAAGGLDTLSSALDDYKKNFFTAAQQTAMNAQALSQQFAALGLTMPQTKDQFVNLVNTLSASGESGQELALKVIDLAGAFNDLTTAAGDNISTLTDNLTTAYNNQSDALTTLKQKMTDFASSLSAFKTSLITGDLSTQNAVEKYATLKAQFEDTEAKAQAGDQTAIGNFQQVAQDFLKASQAVYASGSNYTVDFQSVLAATEQLQQYTAGQASVADQQLTALQNSVSQLITINTSVQSVADAIKALQDAIAAGLGGTGATAAANNNDKKTIQPVVNGSHASGLHAVPWDGYIAELHKDERVLTASEAKSYTSNENGNAVLAAQVKALQEEIAGMRADANHNAMALAGAVVTAAEDNAKTVVQGHKDAASKVAYKEKAKPELR